MAQTENRHSGQWELPKPVTVAPPLERHYAKFPTFAILFGIIMPLLALLAEATTRLCTSCFFDPIPTIWHILLYAFIPLATGVVLWAQRNSRARRLRLWGVINGMAIAIAAVYTLIFIPLMPFAVIGAVIFGIGLLGFSPLMALIASVRARSYLADLTEGAPGKRTPGLWIGIALGLLLLAAAEGPVIVTQVALQMAASDSPRTSRQGIDLLRAAGSRDVMLQFCYQNPGKLTNFVGPMLDTSAEVSTRQAREIYYRVTGEPFNAQAPPQSVGRTRGLFEDFDFDADRGGAAVAGMVKGLSLAESRMDGSVDADAAVGYLEWTMVFNNISLGAQEARLQLALPPDAVVSRLTLWVNGEEREAAFAGRGKVRQAYQEVAVVQQRDPVLVTTCGPDRVLVQCFPVPSNGEMKIRLGITAPLVLESRTQAALPLPQIVERNFAVHNDLRHAIWVEAKQPMQATDLLRVETAAGGVHAVRGELPDAALAMPLRFTRDAGVTAVTTADPTNRSRMIVQRFSDTVSRPPSRIVLVVDGSVGMRAAVKQIPASLRTFPAQSELALIVAGDEPETRLPATKYSTTQAQLLAQQLGSLRCRGGMDNLPALNAAWDLAAEKPDGVIVWVHGPQPIALAKLETLKQRWERRPDGPRLYDVPAVPGGNKVLESLDSVAVCSVPRLGALSDDLARLFAAWTPGTAPPSVTRAAVTGNVAGRKTTSAHLARLWARDEVLSTYRQGGKAKTDAAIALAARYQLVTPVSGAVVLENKQQYQDAGLEPVDPGSVPTVPEPATWMLLAVGGLLLLALWWRRKTTCATA